MSRTTSNAPQTNPSLAKLYPEEYLDRFGVTTYMKDVITLLLENRPEDCLQFMSNYFSNVVHGSSYMIRSYRYIKLTSRNREAFFDNLVAAYHSLNNSPPSSGSGSGSSGSGQGATGMGITAVEMTKLIKQVCQDFPPDLFHKVIKVLTQSSNSMYAVSFPEFAAAINACLLYEDFIRHVEQWFQTVDVNKTGKIPQLELQNCITEFEESFTSGQLTKVKKLLKIKSMNDGLLTLNDVLEVLFELSIPEMKQALINSSSTPNSK